MLHQKLMTCLLLCCFSTVFAQALKKDMLASQGSSQFVYAATTTYFIQQSIGQASVINTFKSTTNFETRQGFLQPVSVSILYSQFDPTIDAAIWPNPFENNININFNEPVVGPLNVVIYDIVGRKVFEHSFAASPQILVQTQGLAQGNYMLQLQSQARSIIAKLIKR